MISVQNMVLSIAGAIRDRTSNPITGTYLLTWSITNYKLFVLLLMGTTAPSLRLAEISILYSSNWDVAWSVGVPLISTFLLLVVYPYITDPLIVKYRTWQVKLANSLRKVEDERLLTAAEGATLFSIHESTRDVSARQIASLESENQRLKIDNAEIHKRVKGQPDAAELAKTFEQRQSERPEVRQRAIVDIIRAVFSEWFFVDGPRDLAQDMGFILTKLYEEGPVAVISTEAPEFRDWEEWEGGFLASAIREGLLVPATAEGYLQLGARAKAIIDITLTNLPLLTSPPPDSVAA